MASRYHEVYDSWKRDPQAFWAAAAEDIDWFKRWDKVFDPDAGVYGRWFTGAECNTAYNCLDRHIERGRADQVALIHDSAILGKIRRFTYRELRDEVVALAAVLRDNGIGKGDRVIIYMPMVAEAAIAMLASARIGAVHSVVFGGFASKELATRIDDARPKMVISASCGLEPGRVVAYKPLLDQAIALAENPPAKCLIVQREQLVCDLVPGRDLDYAEHVGKARADKARHRMRAGRRHRPALHHLHLGHDRPAQGHRARQWRPHGRAEMDHVERVRRQARARPSGRPPTSAGWSAIPTSSTARCCTARPRSCSRASRSARRMPAPTGASLPSMAWWRCSPRRPPSAPSRRKTRAASMSDATTSRASARCSWPASAPIPTPSNGPSRRSRCR